MSSDTIAQIQTRPTGAPRGLGRRGGANRGRGGSNRDRGSGRNGPSENKRGPSAPAPPNDVVEPPVVPPTNGAEAADDEEVCWICAEPVKYYAVSDCNHRTCHVCALRLRALYKKTDCTFCKVNMPLIGDLLSGS